MPTLDDLHPVDMVFAWVDGSDPAHAAKRRQFESRYDHTDIRRPTRADRNIDARFMDVGEISFSVQSVVKYLPWVRTIFIVTDAQAPPVSKALLDSGRVRIVDHADIVPATYLPTFSSRVIESCLHHIPGLSDVFLYNNDDYMHFAAVPRRAFCEDTADGRTRLTLWVKQTIIPRTLHRLSGLYPIGERVGSLHAIGIYNALTLLRRSMPDIAGRDMLVPRHSTHVIRRATASRMEDVFSQDLDSLRRQQFRSAKGFSYTTLLYTMEKAWHADDRVNRAWLQNYSPQFRMFDFTSAAANGRTGLLWRRVARSHAPFVCLNNIPGADRETFLAVMRQKGLEDPTSSARIARSARP